MQVKSSKAYNLWSWGVVALSALVALYALTFPLQDPDTFWHLAYGRAMVEQGRFINHELFSYTAAGTLLGSHSQLAQIFLYLLWSGGGAYALLAFKLFVALSTFFLIVRTAQLFNLGRLPAALLALLVILAGMSRFVERPELFSILLQGLLILLLFGYSRGRFNVRALWLLPLLLVTWDYLHGAIYGLIILLTFTFGETLKTLLVPRFSFLAPWSLHALTPLRLKALWIWSGITLLAMALHPNGLVGYAGFWRVSSRTAEYAMYGEFMPTRFVPQFFWFWVCLFLLLTLMVICFRSFDLTTLLLLLPFLYLGLKFNRSTLALSLAAVPMLAYGMTVVGDRFGQVKGWRYVVMGLPVALWLSVPYYKEVSAPAIYHFGAGLSAKEFPVAATRFIQEAGLSGNMYNTDHTGGYLSFFAPERKIFHYNQPGVFTAQNEFLHKPASRSRWNIRYALISEAQECDLFQQEGFVPVYWEPNGMVMVKPTPENAAFVKKYQIQYFEQVKSAVELEALSKTSLAVAARLCEELSIYLTYSHDARMAALLGKLLRPENVHVQVDLEQRRRWLEDALQQNSGDQNLLQTLGGIAYRQGDLLRAQAVFDEVLVKNPLNAAVLISRGYIDYDRNAYREAADFFSRAVQVAMNEAEPHYALGLAAMRLGDRGLMEQEFQAFLALAPGSPFAGRARQFLTQGQ